MRSADLCWGQRYIYLRHHHLPPDARHDAHIVTTFELPDGVSLAMVRTTLNYLVRRHEALRTTYHDDTDADPRQRVHPPGPLPLVTVTAERDGTETPAEVMERLSTKEFDLATEWPIRACVITSGGRPRQLVLVLNHMAFDVWTVDRFERELETLGAGIAAGKPAALEPIRHQPLDLARYESSAAASAAKDAALAYWRAEIARLPADTFGPRRHGGADPVPRGASLTSPSMLDASRRIAGRHRVWPSVVHLATYTMVMAAYTGSGTVTHLSFTGNRGSTAYADVMTCMFAPLLIRVDCPDNPTFAEVLRRVAARFQAAQEHAYVPYDELVELLAREGFGRGEPVRLGSELNFLSQAAHASRARRTKFTWNATPAAWARYGSDTYFRIYELRDANTIALNAVATVMDADAIERFLRGYETVLLAHDDPATDLRIADVASIIGFTAPAGSTDPAPAEPATEPAPDAESALVSAVRQVNGIGELTTSDCYTVAGGRVLRIPRVLAKLREHGWEGVSVNQLAGCSPLRVLAGRLARVGCG